MARRNDPSRLALVGQSKSGPEQNRLTGITLIIDRISGTILATTETILPALATALRMHQDQGLNLKMTTLFAPPFACPPSGCNDCKAARRRV